MNRNSYKKLNVYQDAKILQMANEVANDFINCPDWIQNLTDNERTSSVII